MKIKIKRATTEGLIECEGLLIEMYGFQFCLTKDEEHGLYFLIELSTGCNLKTIDSDLCKEKKAISKMKAFLLELSESQIKTGVGKSKVTKIKGLEFPINQPV